MAGDGGHSVPRKLDGMRHEWHSSLPFGQLLLALGFINLQQGAIVRAQSDSVPLVQDLVNEGGGFSVAAKEVELLGGVNDGLGHLLVCVGAER